MCNRAKDEEALEAKGLLVEAMPEKFVAESVIECLKPLLSPGERILLPRSDLARKVLVDTLEEMGMHVDEAVAYHTVKVYSCCNIYQLIDSEKLYGVNRRQNHS